MGDLISSLVCKDLRNHQSYSNKKKDKLKINNSS